MNENKNAKTPADGPEYERGFIDGMQRQMQLHVNRVIKEDPTGWVKVYETAPPKKQWVGLTLNEAEDFYDKYTDRAELINAVDKFLEEKNT